MAFENVFGNVDFGIPVRQANANQQQFAQMLGMALSRADEQKERDLKSRQLEAQAQAKANDPKKLAQEAVIGELMGQGMSREQAAMSLMYGLEKPIYDQYGQAVASTPSPLSQLGINTGGQAAPQPSPPMSGLAGDTGYGQGTNPAARGVPYDQIQPLQVQPMGLEDVERAVGGYKANPDLGHRGKVMEDEFQRDVALSQARSDIDFRKQQMKSAAGKKRVTGTIAETMSNLEELNDKLKAKEAIISGDSSGIKNLRSKYGSTWLGRQTGSVTKPEVETLKQQYETTRDSLIPAYIAYFELPATVVDTEEFQQRLLQSFGDPRLTYEANQSALKNMRMQFGLETKEEKGETPKPTPEQIQQELMRRRGQ